MREIYSKKQIIDTLKKCANDYKMNLENKKIIFIIENKDQTLSKFEVAMFPRNFKHFTGLELLDNGRKVDSIEFYKRCLRNSINENNIILKDSTNYSKLEILPQLMNLDKTAKMIGQYDNSKIYLQTDKIIGNINACMGFIRGTKEYIPNTVLKEDIRNRTKERKKVIAILKKKLLDNSYRKITYLKKNYDIFKLLECKNIENLIDFKNLTSNNKEILIKIFDFKEKSEH